MEKKTSKFNLCAKFFVIAISAVVLVVGVVLGASIQKAQAQASVETIANTVTHGIPGQMTVENEIKTALMPVGHCLYIYGGGWNDDTTGKPVADYDANAEAQTIGVPKIWDSFYAKQDSSYTPWDVDELDFEVNPTCVHWGADCSGYLGWVLQNITNKPHGFNVEKFGDQANGWVTYAQNIGFGLSHLGYGKRHINPLAIIPDQAEDPFADSNKINNQTQTEKNQALLYSYDAGDIFTYECHEKGMGEYHCWLCLGQCDDDNSVMLVHCSDPGVFICGTSPNYDEDHPLDCDSHALQIARTYMKRYYTDFYNKFGVVGKPGKATEDGIIGYLKYSDFKWNHDASGLLDVEGIHEMQPDEVLKTIFCETSANANYSSQGQPATIKFNDALAELGPQNSQVIYNLNDKPDTSVVDINFTLPQGYKFDSLTINGQEYAPTLDANSNTATIAVPRSGDADNFEITTASSVIGENPQLTPTTETAQTNDSIALWIVMALAIVCVALFALRKQANFRTK